MNLRPRFCRLLAAYSDPITGWPFGPVTLAASLPFSPFHLEDKIILFIQSIMHLQ
jgi:hypothetical protein